ncbi:uncharacterized protein [Musca autumnalis]|uniref:uncharacterized protein n=1 Tax=Musca autumnalis TaxID=221902 RepID=UPI003CEECA3E
MSNNYMEIEIKNEAIGDEDDFDDDNAQYEEYIITTYGDYEEQEEKHIPLNYDVNNDDECETPSEDVFHEKDTQNDSPKMPQQDKINCHYRNTCVSHLVTHGWTSKSVNDLQKKLPERMLKELSELITQSAKEAEEYVYQECDSLCFSNITKWLQVFKNIDVPNNSFYEPAIIMNAIVNNEQLPASDDLGGVDLKAIYSFLCNALMGLPQPTLDPISSKFLASEFEALIEEVNTEDADQQTIVMKRKIQHSLGKSLQYVPESLDPLRLTEGTIIQDDIINTKPLLKNAKKRRSNAKVVTEKTNNKIIKNESSDTDSINVENVALK